jgi:hypothetical protein
MHTLPLGDEKKKARLGGVYSMAANRRFRRENQARAYAGCYHR